MSLSLAQQTTLRSYVLSTPALSAVGRNDTELARLLNLPSTFSVWRIDVPSTELTGSIKLSSFTPVDTPDNTLLYSNRCALCELKQNNIRLLLSRDFITSQKLTTRQDLTDALTNVPAGVGGSLLDAGWLGAGKVKATITRLATVAESVFATGTGTANQPGELGFEGVLSVDDIGQMWNA